MKALHIFGKRLLGVDDRVENHIQLSEEKSHRLTFFWPVSSKILRFARSFSSAVLFIAR
jgi:hypothetical protein